MRLDMRLQEKIQQDLRASMKEKTEAKTSALRVIVGEFQRQAKKELSDTEVLAIIKKLVKAETEMLAQSKQAGSEYLTILEGYLPRQPTSEEIREWIAVNIDFGRFANKMQAMRPIMAHFGGAVDGNIVKKILEEM
jgi:uncharacterized protein YqeY